MNRDIYYVSENKMLFDKSYTFDSKKDKESFMKKLIGVDLATNCYLQKPSSGLVLCSLTNAQAKITNLTNVLSRVGNLPDYLKNSKCIKSLTHNKNTGLPYEDNLCLFRCFALHHKLLIERLERYAEDLGQEFEEYRGKSHRRRDNL